MAHDVHMHMVLDGVDWKAGIGRHKERVQEDYIKNVLRTYQQQGYTYLRDGGDRWGVGLRARQLAAEYGIVYRTPLAPLCQKGHYGAFIGKTYENLHEYTDLVRETRQQGGNFIKIMISGLMDFDRYGVLTEEGLPTRQIQQLIHIAHEEGFAVMAHANGARTVEAAARVGVDSVEHGAYLDEDALRAMAEHGTVWVPTLSTVANLRGKGRFCEEAVQHIWENAAENVARFADMGGLVGCGSDAGAWAVPHGCGTEERLLEEILGENATEILQKGNQTIVEKF